MFHVIDSEVQLTGSMDSSRSDICETGGNASVSFSTQSTQLNGIEHVTMQDASTITTQDASTITDPLVPDNSYILINHCDSNEEIFGNIANRSTFIICEDRNPCSEIHLQRQENAMMEYLKRLQSSSASSFKFLECDVCGSLFKRKDQFDKHMKHHSENRPFICNVCNKGFKRSEHLRRHVIIHSGTKKFSCSVCGKAFQRKDHLNKHYQIHSAT